MKLSLMVLASLLMATIGMRGDGNSQVTYIGHETVAAALATDHVLLRTPSLLVIGSHRTEAGTPEAHAKEAEVFYVVDGEGTFITGGTLVNNKEISPGQFRGTAIEGGEAHHLVKGDVIVFPAGMPHWFKEVPHSISYFVVAMIKD
jgi:quercetin dioxygenase-like cupin family protein